MTRRRVVSLALALASVLLIANVAAAGPVDLEAAEAERREAAQRQEELQADLDTLLARIGELEAAREQQTGEVERLDARLQTERTTAERASARVAQRYKQAYKLGTGGDPIVLLFGGEDPQDVTERARLLSLMARDSRGDQEAAQGAAVRTEALAGELESATEELAEHTEQLSATRREARDKVAQAQAQVDELDEQIAAERERQAAEQRRKERAAARRAAQQESTPKPDAGSGGGSGSGSGGSGSSGGGSGSGGGSAPVSGGIACPVGNPRSFSDTYGAPRSGGRSHLGVDILAPIGTPSYAYENGTVTRMNGNSLGGISLYLRGNSGNVYYYTHLSGYKAGVSVGQKVSAGQHIAYVGDTGNAAGIPHLHWEVQPGGSGNVNPYPYAKRGCG
ncbi:hypothetical protein BH23ACT10_BH23ACT10_33470 [soil metagenome]